MENLNDTIAAKIDQPYFISRDLFHIFDRLLNERLFTLNIVEEGDVLLQVTITKIK